MLLCQIGDIALLCAVVYYLRVVVIELRRPSLDKQAELADEIGGRLTSAFKENEAAQRALVEAHRLSQAEANRLRTDIALHREEVRQLQHPGRRILAKPGGGA